LKDKSRRDYTLNQLPRGPTHGVHFNIEAKIDAFVDHYDHRRYHESLSNLTPADVYFGRAQTILLERERIKRTQSEIASCNTKRTLHKIRRQMSRVLH
jgi:hypothetical protein